MSKHHVVIVEVIDGIEIVRGINKLQIDPIASQSTIEAELINTSEFISCKAKQDEMKEKFSEASIKLTEVRGRKSSYTEYKQLYDEAMELMKEVRNLLPAVRIARRELFKTHAIYFQPNKRERIKTEVEINNIKILAENLSARKLIKSDGTLVNNYSGLSFFHKENNLRPWIKTVINNIGVDKPAGSTLLNKLSNEEKVEVKYDMNIKRISLLSESEKESEKQVELDKAIINATGMRSGLEIQNDAEALTKSQVWYNNKVTEISNLYA